MKFKKYHAITMFLFLLAIPGGVFSQTNITEFTPYWKHRAELFRTLPNPKDEICFVGDSITDGCEWVELIGNCSVTNRGISGDTAWGVLARIDEITEGQPWKVFLMIGTNDLARGKSIFEVRDKIGEIIDSIHSQSPETEIYLQSVLPVIDGKNAAYKNENIFPLNTELKRLAEDKMIFWVDLAPSFKDSSGQLQQELTEDGLHLNGRAYYLWYSLIRKHLP